MNKGCGRQRSQANLRYCTGICPEKLEDTVMQIGWSLLLDMNKGKGKFALVHAIKAYRGSRGIAPHILNVADRWR